MEILGSTQYVDLSKQKDTWYQLSVTNLWDFSTKSICFKTLSDGENIYYHLKFNTPVSNNTYESETVLEITDEIKQELINKGYKLLKP